ncbi:hypothetical protein [Amycolatopsis sp. lyj-112]|uniref:MmyB family transcriptional regulator n=1 Tax=Amycolatopsis sp. lyj-112 TaxID=2789288 RepID=UPI00397AC54C
MESNGCWTGWPGRLSRCSTPPGRCCPRARHTPESLLVFESVLVADLRAAAARYPADERPRRLVARLWDSGAVGRHESARKVIDHPSIGPIELDCDVLTVEGCDLHIMVYTAEPGSEAAERLALLAVLGTQSLTG